MTFLYLHFCSKILLPLSHPVVGMASPILLLIVGRIFSLFWERPVLSILFGLVLVFFLVFLLSQVFLLGVLNFFFLVLVAVLFQFHPNIS